jgi:hypothetical protein
MNLSSLRPAKDFAINYGVKSIIYGPAGSGKTPLINTAPRPILMACEPGLLSMRNSMVPTFIASDAKRIDEFWEWVFNSNETKNFDTIGVDSVSQMCEIYLEKANKENKHGLAAYGQMATDVLKQLDKLYFLQYKHTYLIAKLEVKNGAVGSFSRPYYPGQQLPVAMPHKYDQILHLDIHNVPSVGQVRSFQCAPTIDVMARDRTGQLNMFEEPDFGKLVQKAMS